LVTNGELVKTVQGGAHDDVSFDEIAGASHVGNSRAVTKRARFVAHVIERVECTVEKRLLFSDLSLVCHFHLILAPNWSLTSLIGCTPCPVLMHQLGTVDAVLS
jgi:hypothetical protein